MLRTVAAIILILCFSLQNISKLIIVLNYQINKDFIAKNLCVNRNKPKSCCQGKCELKKQLDEDDKRQNDQTANKDKYEKEQYCQALKSNLRIADNKGDLVIIPQKLKTQQFHHSVFRPPTVI